MALPSPGGSCGSQRPHGRMHAALDLAPLEGARDEVGGWVSCVTPAPVLTRPPVGLTFLACASCVGPACSVVLLCSSLGGTLCSVGLCGLSCPRGPARGLGRALPAGQGARCASQAPGLE